MYSTLNNTKLHQELIQKILQKSCLFVVFCTVMLTLTAALTEADVTQMENPINGAINSKDNVTTANPETTPTPNIRFVKKGDATATSPEPIPQPTKVIIKKGPNYQFTKINPADPPKKQYQRALQLEVDPASTPAQIQQAAENNCRYYGEQERKNYFINILNSKTKNIISTVLCKNVSGPVVKSQDAPQKPSVEQYILESFQPK